MDLKPKLLLVDDEEAITSNLGPFLERTGFEVVVAGDGQQALDRIKSFNPDAIILDIMMPRVNGREVLRQLRESGDWTPIILLTQVGEASERAMALNEGADDYLNKPFDPTELVARIRAVLRRAERSGPSLMSADKLVAGAIVLNRGTRRVRVGEDDALLTPKAVNLLEYMMTHPEELLTRDRLLDAVWGWDYPAGNRTVDTRIAELRKAIGDDPANPEYIETIPGQGYLFIAPVQAGS